MNGWALCYDQVRKNWDVRLMREVAKENRNNIEAGIDRGFIVFDIFDDIVSARRNLERTVKRF